MKPRKKISKSDIRPLIHTSANTLGWESSFSSFSTLNAPSTPNYFSTPSNDSTWTSSPLPIPERRSLRRAPASLNLAHEYSPANSNTSSYAEGKSPGNHTSTSSPFRTIFEDEEANFPSVFECDSEDKAELNDAELTNGVPTAAISASIEGTTTSAFPRSSTHKDAWWGDYLHQRPTRPTELDCRSHASRVEDLNSMVSGTKISDRKLLPTISYDNLACCRAHREGATGCSCVPPKPTPKLRSSKSLFGLDKLNKFKWATSPSSYAPPISKSSPHSNISPKSPLSSGAWQVERKPIMSTTTDSTKRSKTDSQNSSTASDSFLRKFSSSGSMSGTTFTGPTNSYDSEKYAQSPTRPLLFQSHAEAQRKHVYKSNPPSLPRGANAKPRNAITRCLDKVVDKFSAISSSRSNDDNTETKPQTPERLTPERLIAGPEYNSAWESNVNQKD